MIRLHRIRKSFDGPVLRSVDLHVPKGSLYGLIGPGASGKSVLLKCIPALIRPEAGRVLLGGKNVLEMPESELHELRKSIGMLFQQNALFDFMTVAENVAFPLRRLTSLPEKEIQDRVRERLARVSLPGFEDRYPSALSGGQKKRVGIARATITTAPLLLYDEPAAGLDPVTSQRIFDLLRSEQQASGATVLMVSSDIDRLLTVTDRVGMMVQGRMIFDGSTEEARASQEPHLKQFLRGELQGPL